MLRLVQFLTSSGLNINRGQKILLRLRYAGDVKQFLPMEQVVDTMLHELSHIVFGPHDEKFHNLWNQLREEYEGLLRKGYTGEGFLSEGRMLGGRRVPRHEAQRIARIAAEKRRDLSKGSGQKLGGAPVPVGTDIRNVIVGAIERRATITKGCGSGGGNEKQNNEIADQALRNGFRTKAEEDEANERAIAQALWELVQEDEKAKYGDRYIPPTAANPTGNGGGTLFTDFKPAPKPASPPPVPVSTKPPPRTRPDTVRPVSRLVQQNGSSGRSSTATGRSTPPSRTEKYWECDICTCHNPLTYLCCDACTTERPDNFEMRERRVLVSRSVTPPVLVDEKPKPLTWICHRCTTEMGHQWWTCATCGTLKLSS